LKKRHVRAQLVTPPLRVTPQTSRWGAVKRSDDNKNEESIMDAKTEPSWTTTPLEIDIEELLQPWVENKMDLAHHELMGNLHALIDVDSTGQPIIYLSAGEWMTKDGVRTLAKEVSFCDVLTTMLGGGNLGADDSVTPEEALERIQECVNRARAEIHVKSAPKQ